MTVLFLLSPCALLFQGLRQVRFFNDNLWIAKLAEPGSTTLGALVLAFGSGATNGMQDAAIKSTLLVSETCMLIACPSSTTSRAVIGRCAMKPQIINMAGCFRSTRQSGVRKKQPIACNKGIAATFIVALMLR